MLNSYDGPDIVDESKPVRYVKFTEEKSTRYRDVTGLTELVAYVEQRAREMVTV